MSKRIAFFDFDGTITTKDTLLEFIRFSKGTTAFLIGFTLYSPWMLAFKAGLIPNQRAKEAILTWFFRGMLLQQFTDLCERFADERLPGLLRPGALSEIKRLKSAGIPVVIVSASPENWISPWAQKRSITTIASRLVIRDGCLTGKLNGANCSGEEKVCRIRGVYDLSTFEEVFAYGDSTGDREMLAMATHPHFRPFRD